MKIESLDTPVDRRCALCIATPEAKPCEIGLLLPQVAEYRRRLSDISWMMRLACQPIAVRANREDGAEGRFFAKRIDCKRLQSEVDILN